MVGRVGRVFTGSGRANGSSGLDRSGRPGRLSGAARRGGRPRRERMWAEHLFFLAAPSQEPGMSPSWVGGADHGGRGLWRG